MRYVRSAILNSAVGSVTAVNGSLLDSNQLLKISAQIISTSSAAGTVKFQASNDFVQEVALLSGAVPVNWTDISGMTATVSAAGNALIPQFDVCYRWLRVVYTPSSGTGTIVVNIDALSM